MASNGRHLSLSPHALPPEKFPFFKDLKERVNNINTANKDKREYSDLNLKEVEPITKINLRGKKREFFTKVGQILSVILPTESNTSTSNQELSALWLSPDEWMVYTNSMNKEIFDRVFKEISSLNYGAVTNVSDQWVCINISGDKLYELLSMSCPFDFSKFKDTKGSTTQTIINHIDVIIHNLGDNNINLFVRRSFSNHLWDWLNDGANLL